MPTAPRIFLAAAVADPELQAGKVARIPDHADAPAILAVVQRDRAAAIDEQEQLFDAAVERQARNIHYTAGTRRGLFEARKADISGKQRRARFDRSGKRAHRGV